MVTIMGKINDNFNKTSSLSEAKVNNGSLKDSTIKPYRERRS